MLHAFLFLGYFVTYVCMYVRTTIDTIYGTTYAVRHGIVLSASYDVRHGFFGLEFVCHGFVRHGFVCQRSCTSQKKRKRSEPSRASESSEQREARLFRRRLADREKIGTFALGRVLSRGRRDSLSADLRIEKEQGRVADRRLRRKGKLD